MAQTLQQLFSYSTLVTKSATYAVPDITNVVDGLPTITHKGRIDSASHGRRGCPRRRGLQNYTPVPSSWMLSVRLKKSLVVNTLQLPQNWMDKNGKETWRVKGQNNR